MNPALRAYLVERAGLVDDALAKMLPVGNAFNRTLVEAMHYSLSVGGKRIRPVLILAAADAVDGDPAKALPAAVAMEMIHTYSLIHDDLPAMDDDDLRRGKPSNHKVYGEAIAILSGDGLLTLAFEILSGYGPEYGCRPERILRAVNILAKAAGYDGMVGGQAVDVESEGKTVGRETLDYIHDRKTAALMAASLAVGALLAGGTEVQVERLETFGRKLGLAFQITDDILDIEGETEALGKPVGSDLAKGKVTFPGLVGLDSAKIVAGSLIEEAKSALSDLGGPADPLRWVADYILLRRK